ncbi:MAG: hypothetical protein ACJ8GW_01555 [Massilia sp.]
MNPGVAGTSIGHMRARKYFSTFHALSLLLICATLSACHRSSVTQRLALSDASGKVVATMTVTLPVSSSTSGQSFEGTWQLHSHTGAFPISAVHEGHYLGVQQDGQLLLDLNPGVADNNVVLEAQAQTPPMAGRWRLATVAGFQPGGSFQSSP